MQGFEDEGGPNVETWYVYAIRKRGEIICSRLAKNHVIASVGLAFCGCIALQIILTRAVTQACLIGVNCSFVTDMCVKFNFRLHGTFFVRIWQN